MAEHALSLRSDQEAQALFGKHDQYLRKIEQALGAVSYTHLTLPTKRIV